MHIFAILLFPLRLVAEPLVLPLTYFAWNFPDSPTPAHGYWHFFLLASKAWLLWHG